VDQWLGGDAGRWIDVLGSADIDPAKRPGD
jgi:hypothetical protein